MGFGILGRCALTLSVASCATESDTFRERVDSELSGLPARQAQVARNHFAREIVDCLSYYQFATEALRRGKADPIAIQRGKNVIEAFKARALALQDRDVFEARLRSVTDDMIDVAPNNPTNRIITLTVIYGPKCKQNGERPLERLDYWRGKAVKNY